MPLYLLYGSQRRQRAVSNAAQGKHIHSEWVMFPVRLNLCLTLHCKCTKINQHMILIKCDGRGCQGMVIDWLSRLTLAPSQNTQPSSRRSYTSIETVSIKCSSLIGQNAYMICHITEIDGEKVKQPIVAATHSPKFQPRHWPRPVTWEQQRNSFQYCCEAISSFTQKQLSARSGTRT